MLAEHNKRKKKSSADAIAAGDMEALRDSLSYRQRRFCEEFIVDYNASAAARRAGYNAKHIERQAFQLVNHNGCKAYIEYLDAEKAKTLKQDVLTPEYVVQKAIAGIDKADRHSNLTAYFRGLELLARHLGMFVDRTELSGPDGKAIEIEQRAKQEAQELIATLKNLARKSSQKTEVEIL